MTKQFNIKDLKLNLPDYDSSIGKVINNLVNAYEAGDVTSIFIVYPSKNGVNAAATGRYIELPALALIAHEIADRVCESAIEPFTRYGDEE